MLDCRNNEIVPHNNRICFPDKLNSFVPAIQHGRHANPLLNEDTRNPRKLWLKWEKRGRFVGTTLFKTQKFENDTLTGGTSLCSIRDIWEWSPWATAFPVTNDLKIQVIQYTVVFLPAPWLLLNGSHLDCMAWKLPQRWWGERGMKGEHLKHQQSQLSPCNLLMHPHQLSFSWQPSFLPSTALATNN